MSTQRLKNADQLLSTAASRSTRRVTRQTAVSLSMKVGATVLGLGANVLLARLLGVHGYGVFSYALAIVGLLMIPASLGLPQLAIRHMATYRAQGAYDLARGFIRRSHQAIVTTSLALAALTALILWLSRHQLDPSLLFAALVALALLPIQSLAKLSHATLRGLHSILLGQLPELVLGPAAFLAMLALVTSSSTLALTPAFAIGLRILATLMTLALASLFLRNRLHSTLQGHTLNYDSRAWARTALPFLILGGAQVANHYTDVLMLGVLAGPASAGLYTAAARGAELVTFGLLATTAVLGPTISRLHTQQRGAELQIVMTHGARLATLFALPVTLVLVLLGRPLLALAFGESFGDAHFALAILVIGHFLSTSVGLVGQLLLMTGYERITAATFASTAALNAILNWVFISFWGIEGAALATSATVSLRSLLFLRHVRRKLHVHPSILRIARATRHA